MNVLGSNFRFQKLFDCGYSLDSRLFVLLQDKKTHALGYYHTNYKEDYCDHEN